MSVQNLNGMVLDRKNHYIGLDKQEKFEIGNLKILEDTVFWNEINEDARASSRVGIADYTLVLGRLTRADLAGTVNLNFGEWFSPRSGIARLKLLS